MQNQVGINIRKYREKKGLTQEELGNKVGLSSKTISRYEKGESFPSICNASMIAAALGVSNVDIFRNVVDPKKENKEMVNHPKHYNVGKYEVIDIIEDWKLNFNLGNVTKYTLRAGHKDSSKRLEDLKKAAWYLDREISIVEAGMLEETTLKDELNKYIAELESRRM